MLKQKLKQLPFIKRLFEIRESLVQERTQLAYERKELEDKQKQFDADRRELIAGLYEYLLEQKPSELDIMGWFNYNASSKELVNIFINTMRYKERMGIQIDNDNLLGLLTKAKDNDIYLLYPSFDKVQLTSSLSGNPFQRSSFEKCIKFLNEQDLIDLDRSCCLDIGANIGSTSIYALKSGYFSKTISIEPAPINYQFLVLNARLNNFADQVTPLNYGISDSISQQKIIGNPINCGDFRINIEQSEVESLDLFGEENFTSEIANFTTLDQLIKEQVIISSDIGFIWMDCQGSEGLIFQGGQEFFKEVSAPMYIEFWPYGINRLKGKNSYFSFLKSYSSQIFIDRGKEFKSVSLIDLEHYYNENLETGDYCDILVIPHD